MEARLRDVNSLVKLKNPSLLLQMQKTGGQAPYAHQMSVQQSQAQQSNMSKSKRFWFLKDRQ